MSMSTPDLIRDLEEVIAALDRRVPQIRQAGEEAIARDAAALRAKAIDRLTQLKRSPAVTVTSNTGARKPG